MGSRLGVLKGAAQKTGLSLDDYQAKVDAGEKWCTGCKDWHPKSEFSVDASRWDGRKSVCVERSNARHRQAYRPRPRPEPGRRFQAPRDDDRRQARGRVNHLVKVGLLPNPNDVPCTDCGHLEPGRRPRHEYDHYLGYASDHQEDVEAVCSPCHHRREWSRKKSRGDNSAAKAVPA